MLVQATPGAVATTASLTPGVPQNLRQGNMGDLIVSELHGRYYETAYRRQKYSAQNATAVTTTAGTAGTFTGLMLANPVGSTVNLVLEKVGAAFFVAPAAINPFGIFTGNGVLSATTVDGVKNRYIGGAAGQGISYKAATITGGTSQLDTVFGTVFTTLTNMTVNYDIEGGLIIPPGTFVASWTNSASGASGCYFSFDYEEVPI